MESGLVYGGDNPIYHTQLLEPRVFNCTTGMTYELDNLLFLRGVHGKMQYAIPKAHLFLLQLVSPCEIKVSEYTCESSLADLSIMDSTEPGGFLMADYAVFFSASGGYFFVVVDNVDEDDFHFQVAAVHDRPANRWHCLSMGDEFRLAEADLNGVVVCELRWDAVP